MKSYFNVLPGVLVALLGLNSIGLEALELELQPDGIWVESIELRGNTAINTKEMNDLFSPYYNKRLFAEDLVAIRNLVTRHYIDKGYLSSGATISNQHYSDGILYVDVIEGSLPEISISTTGRLSSGYINRLIRSELNTPLNIQELQTAIQKAEQDVRIDSIRAELRPGKSPGMSKLVLAVAETDPLQLVLKTNNYRSPSVGEAQLQLGLSHRNLTGRGDELSLFYDRTEGTDGGGVDYRFPLFGANTFVEMYYLQGDTIVVEAPFDQIDIKSEIDTHGVIFSRATGNLSGQFILSAGVERKSSKTTLLGERYDFSFGYSNGESKASVLILSGEYSRKTSRDAFVVKGNYRKEIGLFGLQSLPPPVDHFEVFIAQFQYARRFEWLRFDHLVWSLTANLQLTEDILPSFERFALGGHQSVRGYRENSLLKDNAIELLSELEIRILHGSYSNGLEIYLSPFVGFARGWQTKDFPNTSRFDQLSSAGLGIKLFHPNGIGFQVFWAQRFNSKDRFGNSLQDESLHMELRYVF